MVEREESVNKQMQVSATAKKRNVSATLARISGSYWLVLILFGAFLAYLVAKSRFGINVYDEGLALLGAQNVIAGQVPYRDFWTVYPPGSFYLDAALFKVFGSSILVELLAGCAIAFFTVASAFFVTKRVTGQKYAILSLILLVGLMLLVGVAGLVYSILDWAAMLISLVACIYLFRLRAYDRTRDAFILGLITALSMLFRIDTGFYLFVALSVILILCNYSAAKSVSRPKERLRKVAAVWGIYVSGITIVAVPTLVLVLRVASLQDLIYQLVVFPRTIYVAYRSLPPPSIFSGPILLRIFFYFPLVVYAATALLLSVQVVRHKTQLHQQSKPLFLLLLGALFFIYGGVRVDLSHLIPTVTLAIILFSWLVYCFAERLRQVLRRNTISAASSVINVASILAVLLVSLFLLSSSASAVLNSGSQGSSGGGTALVALDLNRARDVYIKADEARNLTDAIAYIQVHVPRNETIFVGNQQHEQIFSNNVIFYFLAERASATKYYDLHPGVATTAVIQNQIINDINRHDTKYVVLWSGKGWNATEPNRSQYPSGVKDLDNFIATNFVPVEHYGDYTIYAREDVVAKSI